MTKVTVNGKEIKTNYKQSVHGYPILSRANNRKTMALHLPKSCRETDEQMLKRLVEAGYSTITFYYTTTRVKGYYDLIAYCKR